MTVRRALITGVTGQDGSYLAELLLDKGYEVHGTVRRSSTESSDRIDHLRGRVNLMQADLLDQASLMTALQEARPHEVYNLGAQSFVPTSWSQPVLTAEFTGIGVTRMLEAVRAVDPGIRFYQASSSRDVRQGARGAAERGDAPSTPARRTASPRSTATSSPSTTASPTGCSRCRASSSTTSRPGAAWSS